MNQEITPPKANDPEVITTKKGKLLKDETGHWKLVEETPETAEQDKEIRIQTSLEERVVANVIAQSAIELARVGVRESRLDAELLLMHTMDWTKETMVRRWTDKILPKDYDRFRALLKRRLEREPLAYIVGYKHFYDLKFFVDDRVLIPRPESELLVEKTLELLRKWNQRTEQFSLVDVGTGCGSIALSLAKHVNFIKIYATDQSADAIDVARINAKLLSLEQSVAMLRGDLLVPLPHPVNLIIANLPYIPDPMLPALAPEINLYEPKDALIGGDDGLDVYRRLFAQVPQYLLKGGKILCEADPGQMDGLRMIALQNLPQADFEVLHDLHGLSRALLVHTPQS